MKLIDGIIHILIISDHKKIIKINNHQGQNGDAIENISYPKLAHSQPRSWEGIWDGSLGYIFAQQVKPVLPPIQ